MRWSIWRADWSEEGGWAPFWPPSGLGIIMRGWLFATRVDEDGSALAGQAFKRNQRAVVYLAVFACNPRLGALISNISLVIDLACCCCTLLFHAAPSARP